MPVRGVRRRYFLFRVDSGAKPTEREIWEIIRDSIQDLYGAKGLSLIDPNLIQYDENESRGILRCTHDTERHLRACLAYIVGITSVAAAIRVERSSGTLKALRKKCGVEKPKKQQNSP